MNLLINLLVYILVFGVIWLILNQILILLKAEPPIPNIVKAIYLLVVLIVILGVFWGGEYFIQVPRIK